MSIPLSGSALDGPLKRVVDHAVARIDRGEDLGVGVTVLRHGAPLLDLRAGWRDRKQTTPLDQTLLPVYSCGKAVLAALTLAAIEQGVLDYDAPVAAIWDAFGQNGKESVTLAQALSHQAGIPGIRTEISPSLWTDWEGICAVIAAETPMWPPGTASGYHPQTVGFIVGECLRRVHDRTVGAQVAALGLDIHCGMTGAITERAGPMVKPTGLPDFGDRRDEAMIAFMTPWAQAGGVDRQAWMAAEIPASNMHATSTGLAHLMQVFATGQLDGREVASDQARAAALAPRIEGPDKVLPFDLSWAAGLMRNTIGALGPSETAVGHYGFGGSFVLADPAHGLSIAFVPNKMEPILIGGQRATSLIQLVYEELELV
ncbi:esterase A [Parvularcula bermudensis HTCC2503]|uniref:Esterase A n=1 Tax=Parvularcula bermudensis (strain ATCC BAA-594 / HTCC2503 / KCTC 12087) TaxID=314260 RepID=E0TI28_PARBH|nr:serine hydrolase domain-containing protein [Parvularcula bermudensis]ADM09367.1 esterase A [Parvularcula bermudensis HTCC2503]